MTGARQPLDMRRSPARMGLARFADQAYLPLLLGLALVGVALALVNTRLGAFLSDDSYYYVYPARDLLAGKGFHPSYIFAPLFPLTLAGFSLLGIEALDAARWLNAILFGVNIFLTGRVAQRAGALAGFSLLAAGLVLLADVVIEAHGWVMSEALSFTFMLLALEWCLAFLHSGQRQFWWMAAAAAALTTLTRYAAVPLIAALALTLLVFGPGKKIFERVKDALLFGLVSLVPVALYWLRNQLVSGHPVRYQRFLFEPLSEGQAAWFFYHWTSLFIPGRFLREREVLAGLAAMGVFAVIVAGLGWAYRKQLETLGHGPFQRGAFLLGATWGMNLLMLYLARGLTELDVLNPRYLVPMLIVFLILAALLAGRLWQAAGTRMRGVLLVCLAVFTLYYAYRMVDFTRHTMDAGLGYANAGWHDSETVPYIRDHPEIVEMVSTGEMGIYFWTGRMPTGLAAFPSPAALRDHLCTTGATLFVMDQMPTEIYGLARDEVDQAVERVRTFNDSSMYRCPGTE